MGFYLQQYCQKLYDYDLANLFQLPSPNEEDDPQEQLGGYSVGDFELLAYENFTCDGQSLIIYCDDLEELTYYLHGKLLEIYKEDDNEFPYAHYHEYNDCLKLAIQIYDVYAVFDVAVGGYGYIVGLDNFVGLQNVEDNNFWEEMEI